MPRPIRSSTASDLVEDLADAQQGDVRVSSPPAGPGAPARPPRGRRATASRCCGRGLEHPGLDDEEEVDAEGLPVDRPQAGDGELDRHPLDVEGSVEPSVDADVAANSSSTLTSARLRVAPQRARARGGCRPAARQVGQPLLAGEGPAARALLLGRAAGEHRSASVPSAVDASRRAMTTGTDCELRGAGLLAQDGVDPRPLVGLDVDRKALGARPAGSPSRARRRAGARRATCRARRGPPAPGRRWRWRWRRPAGPGRRGRAAARAARGSDSRGSRRDGAGDQDGERQAERRGDRGHAAGELERRAAESRDCGRGHGADAGGERGEGAGRDPAAGPAAARRRGAAPAPAAPAARRRAAAG